MSSDTKEKSLLCVLQEEIINHLGTDLLSQGCSTEQTNRNQLNLVGETHGTSGQCVSFSLFDAGNVLLRSFSFLFFQLNRSKLSP